MDSIGQRVPQSRVAVQMAVRLAASVRMRWATAMQAA